MEIGTEFYWKQEQTIIRVLSVESGWVQAYVESKQCSFGWPRLAFEKLVSDGQMSEVHAEC